MWFPPGPAVPLSIHPHKKNSFQEPCLWRAPFPKEIQQAIVSSSNPLGDISNSDLELCGTIAHAGILVSTVPVLHLTTCNLSDNTPAIAWRTKGSTTLLALPHTCCKFPPFINAIFDTNPSYIISQESQTLWQMIAAVCGN